MMLNDHCSNDNNAHSMWQAWRAQAKASRSELLSEETIDPMVQAHMTLTNPNEETLRGQRLSYVLEECHLSDEEWESHCMENIMSFRSETYQQCGLALVPLRRSSHT